MENLKPEEQPNIEDIKGTGLKGYEKLTEPKKEAPLPQQVVAQGEAPSKWTPEEEQEIRTKAYKVFEKRMRGEIPAEKTDKILEENGITPWTPEAQKFMEKWDWLEAEKEYARMKEARKEEKKEEPKVETKEEPQKGDQSDLKAEAKKELEEAAKEVAAATAEIPPEVTAMPEQVPDDSKAIEAEIKKLPEEVRQRVGFSLGNIGYWIERGKGEALAGAIEKALGKIDPRERGFVDRFLTAIKEKSARDAEVADKKMEDIEKGRQRTLGNVGYVAKNVYNVARPVADFIGWTAFLPLRYVSIIAASGAVTADVLKETRLKSEKAIEKTRIQDVNEAMAEATRVYEKAGGIYDFEKGGSGVSVEALKKAYLEDIPVSLKDRLRNNPEAGLLGKISNSFFTWHIEKSVNNLNKKIEKIEKRTDWTPQRKSYEKERIFNNYRKRLNDFDRMLGQAGAVDTLAMLGKYGDLAGKATVAATAVLMLKPAFDKFWDWIAGGTADVIKVPSFEEILGIDSRNGLDEGEAKKIVGHIVKMLEKGDGESAKETWDYCKDIKIQGIDKTFGDLWNELISGGKETPKTTIPWEDLIDNEGIIGHDSIWQSTKHIVEAHAQEMGYTGDLNDAAALDKWAETQTANLVNTLAEAQGGKVKDLVHGGPDIGEYDKVIVHKVDGKWVLDFKAESGIEPGYLPEKSAIETPEIKTTPIDFEEQQRKIAEEIEKAGSANAPEYKAPETPPAAPEAPPQEIPLASPEPAKGDLVKEFEKITNESERQAFTYNYILSKADELNISEDKAWAFSRTFGKDISYIDTPEELHNALRNFDRQLDFTKNVLAKGELPISDKVIFVAENASGQMFDLEHPTKDVYRVIKQLPDGRHQYIGNGWLNKKDWDLGAVKKFLGY